MSVQCRRTPSISAGGEGGVHQLPQGTAHVGPVDEQVPHSAQRRLGLTVLAGHRDPLDAHVDAQPEQHQQQPAPQHVLGQVLPRCHRGELGDEVGVELGVLQDVQQVDGAPAALDLALDGDLGLRFLLLAARRDPDPRSPANR
jgi:hypothetical protein